MSRSQSGFPGGSAVKNLLANAGDASSIPGSGQMPWGNDNPCTSGGFLDVPTVPPKVSPRSCPSPPPQILSSLQPLQETPRSPYSEMNPPWDELRE